MCLEFETWLVQPVCFAGSLRPWPGRRQHGCGTSSACQPDREHFRLDWIISGADHDLRQRRPGCAWRQGDSHRVTEPGRQHPVARWWEPHADPRWRCLASGRGNKGENKTLSVIRNIFINIRVLACIEILLSCKAASANISWDYWCCLVRFFDLFSLECECNYSVQVCVLKL